ncbi:MAG: radical SAM protein [Candidatus Thermoplasmatota archaeon]|nr:radical SAM protein [Euryarchaeota archaeon]MBU4031440.1 radical SAM protein [Candidatus Thermoplasmatota archaeon]MBU4070638.1 radical SAM protein [Candidatus Thermoplasmatota archaeon]MBU4145133.1 radical SAM protein [Candidatus Thermoplasmatota archaeon]MBU4591583.1 radical SAM protein [Candidatus Thermoplasmatota archaeon]
MSRKLFRAYYVWPDFPSISLSGESCSLNCLHCGRTYLGDMEPATSPERLVSLCEELKKKGAKGVLLSGGCDSKGRMLNLEKLLPAIRAVHDMGLIIKLHTGFAEKALAKEIVGAGVDIASMEMVGDAGTVKHIFGLDATPEDYLATFKNLQDAGVPHICPHVCVGLRGGKLVGEFHALDLLAESINISTLAIIVMRPTKGTALAHIPPPTGADVESVVAHARKLFPDAKIILGALRPRGSEEKGGKVERLAIELGALRGGIDGAEVPSREMLDAAMSMGMAINKIQAYGVLPVDFEKRVRTEI